MLQLTQITVSRVHLNGAVNTHVVDLLNIVQVGQRICLGAVHKHVGGPSLQKAIAITTVEKDLVYILNQINVEVRSF